MQRLALAAVTSAVCVLGMTGLRPASADVLVNISKSSQRMSVLVDGTTRYNWKVSTGARNYTTPSGVYAPQWMARRWFSKKYHNAPMPHSIFFYEGYAIHGTTEVSRLGRIASHGCVRLHPDNAAKLFELVQKQMASTRVVVSDDTIDTPDEAPQKKKINRHVAESKPVIYVIESIALAPPSVAAVESATTLESAAIAESAASVEKPALVEQDEARATPARTEEPVRIVYGAFRR